MQKKLIYVANWKMYLTYQQELQWLEKNLNELENLEDEIIICPSFVSLSSFNKILNNKKTKLGAQSCSNFEAGPYTGEISVNSLDELNCKYCIVGHSERRQYFGETNESTAKKASILLSKKITPIICIGETQSEYEKGLAEDIIHNEIGAIRDFIKRLNTGHNEIFIAYEPIWAIGSGMTPSNEYIQEIATFVKREMENSGIKYKLLYGGSVNEHTISELKKSEFIDGFLIGKASTDFQELKKIVL